MAGPIVGLLVLLLAVAWWLRRAQASRETCASTGAATGAGARLRDNGSGFKGSVGGSRSPRGDRSARPARRYAAVSIRPGRDACAAVGEFCDQTILAPDAPALPVTGCDREQCRCRYEFFDDRRQEDRRTLYGVEHGMIIGDAALDKRSGEDRRQAGG